MPAVAVEEVGRSGQRSRDGNQTARRKYRIKNAANEATAEDALYGYLVDEFGADPPDEGGMYWWDIDVTEDLKNQWVGVATWKRYQHNVGESQFNFEISVESTRVLVPVSPITTYAASGAPAITLQLIGDRCDGREPEGADISIPTHTESITKWVTGGDISGLKAAAKLLVGRTNNDSWNGHAAGECLLLGAGGTRRGLGDWEITFRWAVRQNQTGLAIGNVTGVNKQGWEFLWPISKITGDVTRRQVTHVAVAKVYLDGDFSALGI